MVEQSVSLADTALSENLVRGSHSTLVAATAAPFLIAMATVPSFDLSAELAANAYDETSGTNAVASISFYVSDSDLVSALNLVVDRLVHEQAQLDDDAKAALFADRWDLY